MDFFNYFWEEFGFRGVLLNFSLRKINIWKAIILNALLYSIFKFTFLCLSNSFLLSTLLWIFLEALYIFLIGILLAFIYLKIQNLIIMSPISFTLNVLIRISLFINIIGPSLPY
ncbi:MAG: type II CAAX prenyl endopeptidase Rce1 family protein [Candidatus Thorarchaeota archaeon]